MIYIVIFIIGGVFGVFMICAITYSKVTTYKEVLQRRIDVVLNELDYLRSNDYLSYPDYCFLHDLIEVLIDDE